MWGFAPAPSRESTPGSFEEHPLSFVPGIIDDH
jgi:hypothetical protein